MPRLYGPGHFTEDPYSQVVSLHGIAVDDLVAVLQKEIRRSRIDNAVLAAYEMPSGKTSGKTKPVKLRAGADTTCSPVGNGRTGVPGDVFLDRCGARS